MTAEGKYQLKKISEDGLFNLYCDGKKFGAIAQIGDQECLVKIDNYSTTVPSIEEGLKVAQKVHPLLIYLNMYGSFLVPKEIREKAQTPSPTLAELTLSNFPNLNETDPGLGQALISVQNVCCLFLQDLEKRDDENFVNYIAQMKDGMRLLGQILVQFEKELWRSAYDR